MLINTRGEAAGKKHPIMEGGMTIRERERGGEREAALPDTPARRKPPPSVCHCPAEMTGNNTVTQRHMSV